MTKPSDASMRRAKEWWTESSRTYESLAALLDAVRDEALEEAANEVEGHVTNRDVGETGGAVRFRLVAAAKRIRALKVKP